MGAATLVGGVNVTLIGVPCKRAALIKVAAEKYVRGIAYGVIKVIIDAAVTSSQ